MYENINLDFKQTRFLLIVAALIFCYNARIDYLAETSIKNKQYSQKDSNAYNNILYYKNDTIAEVKAIDPKDTSKKMPDYYVKCEGLENSFYKYMDAEELIETHSKAVDLYQKDSITKEELEFLYNHSANYALNSIREHYGHGIYINSIVFDNDLGNKIAGSCVRSCSLEGDTILDIKIKYKKSYLTGKVGRLNVKTVCHEVYHGVEHLTQHNKADIEADIYKLSHIVRDSGFAGNNKSSSVEERVCIYFEEKYLYLNYLRYLDPLEFNDLYIYLQKYPSRSGEDVKNLLSLILPESNLFFEKRYSKFSCIIDDAKEIVQLHPEFYYKDFPYLFNRDGTLKTKKEFYIGISEVYPLLDFEDNTDAYGNVFDRQSLNNYIYIMPYIMGMKDYDPYTVNKMTENINFAIQDKSSVLSLEEMICGDGFTNEDIEKALLPYKDYLFSHENIEGSNIVFHDNMYVPIRDSMEKDGKIVYPIEEIVDFLNGNWEYERNFNIFSAIINENSLEIRTNENTYKYNNEIRYFPNNETPFFDDKSICLSIEDIIDVLDYEFIVRENTGTIVIAEPDGIF